MSRLLYPTLQQPPFAGPETVTESRWHQPLSEPVRQKIAPALAIALMASGLFSPIIVPVLPDRNEAMWHQGWSQPVRIKPQVPAGEQQAQIQTPSPPIVSFAYYNWLSNPVRQKPGLGAWLQATTTPDAPAQPDFSKIPSWYAPFSEPVRIRRGEAAQDQPFFFYEPFIVVSDVKWYNWLSEPVRIRLGLKAPYQQFLAYHPRVLPPADVTATMAATETNTDEFLGAINVYSGGGTTSGGSGAKVSVVETGPGGDPVSIQES